MSNTAECEVCGAEENSENIESTANYECVCSSCRNELWCCDDCCGEFTAGDDKYPSPGGDICHDCRHGGDYSDCDSCGDIIDIRNGDYYNDDEYSGEIVCHNCNDATCTCCENCGADIYFYEVGTDHYYEQRCEDCWNRRGDVCISDTTRSTINVSSMHLKDAYRRAGASDMSALKEFYGYALNDYEYNPYLINKDCLGPQTEEADDVSAWWKGQITISSPVYKRVAQVFYEMMQIDTFLQEHKKYGLYHPLRHIFRKHIKYYNRKEGTVTQGSDLGMQELGQNYYNYSLEHVNVEAIIAMLKDNKTDDGADLKRAINQVFSRAYKLRFPQYAEYKQSNWDEYFQQYQTNVVNTKVNVQIGFDLDTMMENLKRGEAIRSCQTRGNNLAYAFGAFDMAVNQHLLAIFRNDDGELIGRAVIRLFKEQWDNEHPMFIAPSRIYLSQHTQAKKEVYVGLFQALNNWAKESFAEGYQLVAYRHSRHDASIVSFISDSTKINLTRSGTRPNLETLAWSPLWETKPDGDADFTYYKDEDQRCRMSTIRRNTEASPNLRYAAQEYISSTEYYTIEVNENE